MSRRLSVRTAPTTGSPVATLPSTFTRRRAPYRMAAKSKAALAKQLRALRLAVSRIEAQAAAMKPGDRGRAVIVRMEPPKSDGESARVWVDEY